MSEVHKHGHNADITALLNRARDRAVKAMEGWPVTDKTLYELAYRVKCNILSAIAIGEWRRVNVVDPDDFADLRVIARRGQTLTREPPVCIEYDFKDTKWPALLVSTVKP